VGNTIMSGFNLTLDSSSSILGWFDSSCPTGNYSFGILPNGTFQCRSDTSGGTTPDLTNFAKLNETQTFTGNNTFTGLLQTNAINLSTSQNITLNSGRTCFNPTCSIYIGSLSNGVLRIQN